ncbi:DUF2269 family protein [Halobacillus litoralis]|uniref:DUF2269 family protein n=1 Tax=Halobacillus litoralis TaxID=45668 RepID=UPI001CFC5985|nr:DUF2269 family protein [Halobacillus litoralis]
MLFKTLLSIHILSAIIGIGATFMFPLILAMPKTLKGVQSAVQIVNKGANYPKIGSVLLLLTGLGMGLIKTSLFQQGWFITAIILLLTAVLIYVLRILPRLKEAQHLVDDVEGDVIPEPYYVIKANIKPFMITASTIDIVIILLMIWKPF